jgi:hypothetical protein
MKGIKGDRPCLSLEREPFVPTISMFYGIMVAMYFMDNDRTICRISTCDTKGRRPRWPSRMAG